jgi:hypothetical protein
MSEEEFKDEISSLMQASAFEPLWQRMCQRASGCRSAEERHRVVRVMIEEYLKDDKDDDIGGPGVMSQWDEDCAIICLCKSHRLERCNRCFMDFVEMNANAREEERMEKQQLCGNNCKRPGVFACSCTKVCYCCQLQRWPLLRRGCTGVHHTPSSMSIT